jgi:transcriptional regulator with XRE-family HTH domain
MTASKHFEGLGEALRLIRMRQDRKLSEVAEAAGITRAMLSSYETGKQLPSIGTLEKVMAALGVSLGELHLALLEVRRSGNAER